MSDHIPPANLFLIFKKEGFAGYSLANDSGLPIKSPAGLAQAGANRPFVDINLLTTLTKEMKVNKNLAGYSFLSSFHSPNPEHVFVLLEKNEPTPDDDFETIHRPLPEIPSKTVTTTGTGAGTIKSAATGWVTTSIRDSITYESDSAVSVSPKNGYYHRIWKAVDQVHKLKDKTKHQLSKAEIIPSASSIPISHIAQSVCDDFDDEYIGWTVASTTDSATATVSSGTMPNNESTTLGGWCPVDTFSGDALAHAEQTIPDDVSLADTEPVDDSFYERYYEKRTVPLPTDETKEPEKSSKDKKDHHHARGVHRCRRGNGRQMRPRVSHVEKMMIPTAEEIEDENAKRRKVYETWRVKQALRGEKAQKEDK